VTACVPNHERFSMRITGRLEAAENATIAKIEDFRCPSGSDQLHAASDSSRAPVTTN
jgi:hypothetical protein